MVTAKQEANENMIPGRKYFSMNVYQLSVITAVLARPTVMIILCHQLCYGTMLKASEINS